MSAPAVSHASASQTVTAADATVAAAPHPSKLVIAGMILAFALLLVGAIRLSPTDTARCDYSCGGAASAWFGSSFLAAPH